MADRIRYHEPLLLLLRKGACNEIIEDKNRLSRGHEQIHHRGGVLPDVSVGKGHCISKFLGIVPYADMAVHELFRQIPVLLQKVRADGADGCLQQGMGTPDQGNPVLVLKCVKHKLQLLKHMFPVTEETVNAGVKHQGLPAFQNRPPCLGHPGPGPACLYHLIQLGRAKGKHLVVIMHLPHAFFNKLRLYDHIVHIAVGRKFPLGEKA